jgi:hypothetical protein
VGGGGGRPKMMLEVSTIPNAYGLRYIHSFAHVNCYGCPVGKNVLHIHSKAMYMCNSTQGVGTPVYSTAAGTRLDWDLLEKDILHAETGSIKTTPV